MPYITQDDRKQYDQSLDDLGFCLDEYGYVAGHVTYVLYKILLRWWKKNPCYDTICQIRGCLIGTLSELDRRFFFPYEDKKIRENGDVVTLYHTHEGMALTPACVCEGGDRICGTDARVNDEYFDADGNDTRGGA
jgi:hypothetical protein